MTPPPDTTVAHSDNPSVEPVDQSDVAVVEAPDATPVAPLAELDGPDRADAPVSEITERFLKVVLAHIPLARIEELHLFSPLRQGGVETGIAVIAARVPVRVAEPPDAPELALEDDVVAADVVAADEVAADVVADDVVAADIDAVVAEPAPTPRIRHTVFTARYRLVQKGPERGKWEADVVAEAEAPLVTVDLVVRGVQRRAGEESAIVRYTGAQLARALRVPYVAL